MYAEVRGRVQAHIKLTNWWYMEKCRSVGIIYKFAISGF